MKKEFTHVLVVMSPVFKDARTLNLAKSLINQGNSVIVIGLDDALDRKGFKITDFDGLEFRLIEPENFDRMFKLWIYFWRKAGELIAELNSEIIWAMDLYSVPICYHHKKSNSKLVYDSREVYSALGMNAGKPLKQWVISEIERFYIYKTDAVFTSGSLDSEYLSKWYDIPLPPAILNLPNDQQVEKSNKLRTYFDIPESRRIMIYQGMIHPGRGIEPFIKQLKQLPNWVLCIVGNGRYWDDIYRLAQDKGVTNQVFKRSAVPYKELLTWTASADAGLCFIEPLTESLKFALPNKLFEYAMAGIPSVCSNLPQMAPIINECGNGIILPIDASDLDWKYAIQKLDNEITYHQMIQASRQTAKKYNWQAQDSVIRLIIGNLTS